jgi:type III pantothenate kinase
MKNSLPEVWIALSIGNSRWHWGSFKGTELQESWDSDRLYASDIHHLTQQWQNGKINPKFPLLPPLYLASVIPEQTSLWDNYPNLKKISLADLPLQNLYPTLGIDRALALLGAGENWGWPILVIDAGTAMTFTGANADRELIGGAILPGLGLQFKSLYQGTAALPQIDLPLSIPDRWAVNTPEAIQSGIIHTILAGIKDFIKAWQQEYPDSKIIFTGGDRAALLNYLQSQAPQLAAEMISDANLIFWGMRSLYFS